MDRFINFIFPAVMLGFVPLIGLNSLPIASAAESLAPRERDSFNDGWVFQKGDPAGADILSYHGRREARESVIASTSPAGLRPGQRKLGEELSYVQPGFDDSFWRKVTLPHDWAIEGPFDQNLSGETAKLPYAGVGWYRKRFTLPSSDAGRQVYLDVDGAMSYAMIWCNGQFVGGWPYGYSSFRFDLTPYLKPGHENVVSIRLDNPDESSRWYPGAGLYRNVWLVKNNPVHVAHWGTCLTTPEIGKEWARINLKVDLENQGDQPAKVQVATDLQDEGKSVGLIDSGMVTIPSHGKASTSASTRLANPKLWNTTDPHLYTAVTTVSQDGKVVDRYETPFGIRTIQFNPDHGFLLNGERVQIQGVCNHHDLGALGAAFNTRAAERQLQIMKEMGCNALRTSHNPPAPELLDLCDRMGILVMDESFDCWETGKKDHDYHTLWRDWHEKDLRAEIRRDRNHPCVILWSIGNELRDLRIAAIKDWHGEALPVAPAMAASLTEIARQEDPTRPTVLGTDFPAANYDGVQKSVGVMGQNYETGGYAEFHKENPAIPLIGSETCSAVSSRGEYFFETPEILERRHAEESKRSKAKGKVTPSKPASSGPLSKSLEGANADFQVGSYDMVYPPVQLPWGSAAAWGPDREFKSLAENPHVAGEFVWTGFDYLGEPHPYAQPMNNLLNFRDPVLKAAMEKELDREGKISPPSRSSYFGIVDLCGFPKDRYYIYQAHWRPEFPMAHLVPHWNWPDRVGQVTPVYVYTSGDEAELFLNGKSLGRRKKGPGEYRLTWDDVVYQPGELKVVAYKDGKKWAEEVVKTTGPAAKLLLKADRQEIQADGKDLAFVTLTVADKDGLLVLRAKNPVKFTIDGPGEIVATDNGDATDQTTFSSSERKAYNGLALAIVRAKTGQPGVITVKAEAEGLGGASMSIRSR